LLNVLIHDLGNPFTIIFTFLTLAKPDPSNERLYKSWERTLQAKKIILQIIGTVREFQALRLGKLPLKIRYVSLDQMIRDCLFLYEDRLTEKSINVRFLNCEKQQFWVEADDNTLKNQVLANILSNAIKFSPDGGIIDISMLSDADRVKLRIRDHGEGVPENLKTRIFDLDSPTTRLGTMGEKGTGIGLPIVKEYVARMGGQIRLLPLEPNESGACFELEFTGASPSEAS
jgi:signal transduction histidine kinase